MDRLQPVGGSDEQNPGQVERQIQVMIGEGVVLGRVQHFQQSGGGVAAKIRADLVKLVEQDDRVAAFDAAQGLDDAAGESADVSAAVPSNFRLIAHAAEGDPGEFPAQRVGHAPAQGGLAHAGRSDQAKNGPLDLFAALDDGQELHQAVFDLRQPEMLVIENALGFRKIDLVFRLLRPRQAENPVEIMAGHAIFGSGRGHLLQPLQFLQ